MPAVSRILVPIDFSASSRSALEYATFLAGAFGAELVVLHVREPIGYVGPDTLAFVANVPGQLSPEQARADAAREVEQVLARAGSRPSRVDLRIEAGDPMGKILGVSADVDADLVVMGTHGRTGLSRLVVGSVAEGVIRRSSRPVLVVRSPPKASRETRAAPMGGDDGGER
jgi:nucleotide-binding universal stress UspA family protein